MRLVRLVRPGLVLRAQLDRRDLPAQQALRAQPVRLVQLVRLASVLLAQLARRGLPAQQALRARRVQLVRLASVLLAQLDRRGLPARLARPALGRASRSEVLMIPLLPIIPLT